MRENFPFLERNFFRKNKKIITYSFPDDIRSSGKVGHGCRKKWTTKLFFCHRKSMFIQTQSTPNLQSLMFYPGKPVMEVGSADFPNARTAMNSPLAKALFGIDGVTRVFFGSNFVTVTKSDDTSSWDFLKPEIFAAIIDFYSSGKSLFLHSSTAAALDTAIHQDDSETVAMIKQLLETRIRPAVQDDSGDIEYIGFDPESGIVKLKMQGACSGCPSSSGTLKSGIENMLMHYVPEVSGNKRKWNGNYDRGNQQQSFKKQENTQGAD
ncbi:nifU-like protein 4, mitochondrial [Rutidosis leptorrhynchoides]|uniref:nifU-like protein 4, mitochondrial n=1 Tax=Rutidosis leptorrhynchoides TaxID=125765 RepID=UPI003A98F900